MTDEMALPAETFARMVAFAMSQPEEVDVNEILFRPTHPLGQTVIVTAGCGLVQSWGGPVEKIRPGDVIRCPPGEKHWHGATPTTAMTHIAIVEKLDGKTVDWLEKVSDEQYESASRA